MTKLDIPENREVTSEDLREISSAISSIKTPYTQQDLIDIEVSFQTIFRCLRDAKSTYDLPHNLIDTYSSILHWTEFESLEEEYKFKFGNIIIKTIPYIRDVYLDSKTINYSVSKILESILSAYPLMVNSIISSFAQRKEKLLEVLVSRFKEQKYFILQQLLNFSTQQTQLDFVNLVEDEIISDENKLIYILPILLTINSLSVESLCKKLVLILEIKYGITNSQLWITIKEIVQAKNIAERFISNTLKTAKELHEYNPLCIPYLSDTYGINVYGRYSTKILIEMFESRESHSVTPNVLVIYAREDTNNALINGRPAIAALDLELNKLGYKLRVIECSNIQELSTNTLRSYTKFGKPSGLIIFAHGTIDSIILSDAANGSLEFEQLMSTREGKIIKNGLHRAGTSLDLVFISCSTGANNGIASRLSKELEVKITAPIVDTALKSIQPSLSNGQLVLTPDYTDESVTYFDGNIVNKLEPSLPLSFRVD